MKLVAFLAVVLTTPAAAESDLARLQRWLWPSPHLPVPIEAYAIPAPVVLSPEVPPVVLSPEVPPVVRVAAPRRPHKPKGTKVRVVAADNGPDLPWPCWLVRAHAAGKTRAELEADGRRYGITLTPKQRRQATACLAGG